MEGSKGRFKRRVAHIKNVNARLALAKDGGVLTMH